MNSQYIHRMCSAGRQGRDEALMVASSGLGGCPSNAYLRKHASHHLHSAVTCYKDVMGGYISASEMPATTKRRRSDCFNETEWAIDSEQRPVAKRVHNACKENNGIPSRPAEPQAYADAISMEGIGPGFMKLAMGLVLPLNLDSVQQIPRNHRKLSEHERQANARKLLDEELSRRLKLAVASDQQFARISPTPGKVEQPSSTMTESTSPSDVADAAMMTSRDCQTHSCESSHMR
eukprot:jgi/Ulvmu1/190/UM001_0194.1